MCWPRNQARPKLQHSCPRSLAAAAYQFVVGAALEGLDAGSCLSFAQVPQPAVQQQLTCFPVHPALAAACWPAAPSAGGDGLARTWSSSNSSNSPCRRQARPSMAGMMSCDDAATGVLTNPLAAVAPSRHTRMLSGIPSGGVSVDDAADRTAAGSVTALLESFHT